MVNRGFIVVETCEDYEMVLCIEKSDDDKLPLDGILAWPNEGYNRTVFSDRKSARDAINRTHYYAKAFGYTNMPEKKYCKIHVVDINPPSVDKGR
jgi:hypothetical protein